MAQNPNLIAGDRRARRSRGHGFDEEALLRWLVPLGRDPDKVVVAAAGDHFQSKS